MGARVGRWMKMSNVKTLVFEKREDVSSAGPTFAPHILFFEDVSSESVDFRGSHLTK